MLDHLPERDRPARQAAAAHGMGVGEPRARAGPVCSLLAGELARSYPGAAASLREGMQETLTLTRLGIRGRAEAHAVSARTRSSR